jgi:hypothetical protein
MSVQELMGKVVLVDRVYKRTHPVCDDRRLYKRTHPMCDDRRLYKKVWQVQEAAGRPGWIVGERWIQNGATEWSYGGDDPPVWRVKNCVHVLLVTYWPTLKPVHVPFDGYRPAPLTVQPYPTKYRWSERDKDVMRNEMKDWPRDEKGKWVKKCSTKKCSK